MLGAFSQGLRVSALRMQLWNTIQDIARTTLAESCRPAVQLLQAVVCGKRTHSRNLEHIQLLLVLN